MGDGDGYIACRPHDDLELYCRREEAARELKETRENKEYLPGVRIPVHVKITSDLEKAVSGADCVVLSTPSKAVETTAEAMAPFMKKMLLQYVLLKVLPMRRAIVYRKSFQKSFLP